MTYSSATHALSVNPATGETLAAYPWATSEEVEQAITLADAGFRQSEGKGETDRLPEQSVAARQSLAHVRAGLRRVDALRDGRYPSLVGGYSALFP